MEVSVDEVYGHFLYRGDQYNDVIFEKRNKRRSLYDCKAIVHRVPQGTPKIFGILK